MNNVILLVFEGEKTKDRYSIALKSIFSHRQMVKTLLKAFLKLKYINFGKKSKMILI
jgi:hypothetical protein